jgi:hypothetical protein
MEETNPSQLSSMVSMAYSNLAPDFREIWIKCLPTLDQGFGRASGTKRCLSSGVPTPTRLPDLQSGPALPIFQLTAVIDVA